MPSREQEQILLLTQQIEGLKRNNYKMAQKFERLWNRLNDSVMATYELQEALKVNDQARAQKAIDELFRATGRAQQWMKRESEHGHPMLVMPE